MLPLQLFGTYLLLFTASVLGTVTSPFADVWSNLEYKRVVNVAKSYTQESLQLRIKNIGSSSQGFYFLAFPDSVFEGISVLSAVLPEKKVQIGSSLYPEKVMIKDELFSCALIKLPRLLEPGETIRLAVSIAYKADTFPYPEKLALGSNQKLRLNTTLLPYSLYDTEKFDLEIFSPEEVDVLEMSENIEYQRGSGLALRFATVRNTNAATSSSMSLLYSHNLPLTRVKALNRRISVSHWTNSIQFEDYYEITNDAAKLKGGFSRVDYMKGQHPYKQGNYILGFEVSLPEDSTDYYYHDLVGKIASFKAVGDKLYLKPRFPIFGGWFYNFTIGWYNDLSSFLRASEEGDEYILKVPLLNGITDSFYEDGTIEVTLPAYAELLAVEATIPTTYIKETKTGPYLVGGRVKVELGVKNLVDSSQHANLLVKYKYTKTQMYLKPLLLALYIFGALLVPIFSIS